MEESKLTYKLIEGKPSNDLLNEILQVYKSIFEDYKLDFFKNRIHKKEGLIIILCYHQTNLAAFKIGYKYNETTFYSWVGGVLPEYRQKGVAKKLAKLQEQKAIEKGYSKLRTKSMNQFKPMIILNLKNGFNIVNVYTNDLGQRKIVFEKDLN